MGINNKLNGQRHASLIWIMWEVIKYKDG